MTRDFWGFFEKHTKLLKSAIISSINPIEIIPNLKAQYGNAKTSVVPHLWESREASCFASKPFKGWPFFNLLPPYQ